MPEDCTRCGACCFSESERHARVMGDDYARLGDEAADLVAFVGHQAFMRIVRGRDGIGRCCALVVDPSTRTFHCSVYERRPEVCRELERASPACEGERATKGERPRRLLFVLGRGRSTAPA